MSWQNDIPRPVPSYGPAAPAAQASYDAGLRAYMIGVYNHLLVGLALSGLVAYAVTQTPLGALFLAGERALTPLGWVALLAPLGLILIASFKAHRLSPAAVQAIYWAIAALQGVGLGALVQAYTGESVARVFAITAAAFGALSLWGYTTRQSLSGLGAFLVMGLVGLVLASLANLFVQSSALGFAISLIGVGVFAGLTAWDTQRLKEEYLTGFAHEGEAAKSQVFGALSLYLNVLNLFQLLLSLLGSEE